MVRAFGGLLAFEGNSLFFREFLFALVLVMETEGFVTKDEFAANRLSVPIDSEIF